MATRLGYGSSRGRENFARLTYFGDQRFHGNGGAGLHDDASQNTAGWRRHFDDAFVHLHRQQRLVLFHRVAFVFEPLGDGAFLHGQAEHGHGDLGGHALSAPC